MPPFSWVLDGGTYFKDRAARVHGEPPFGHAETSSLKQFSAFLGLDSDLILQKMREADFKGEPKPESIFIDIAKLVTFVEHGLDFVCQITSGDCLVLWTGNLNQLFGVNLLAFVNKVNA